MCSLEKTEEVDKRSQSLNKKRQQQQKPAHRLNSFFEISVSLLKVFLESLILVLINCCILHLGVICGSCGF